MLFDRFNDALIDKKVLVVHEVIHVERACFDRLRLLKVARCEEKILVGIIRYQKYVKALIAFLRRQDHP